MNTIDFDQFLRELSAQSEEQFIDPAAMQWPDSIDADAWYFTPELISIFGTPAWEALDEAGRKRLSLTEAVNFFSLNIHGERYLISEISARVNENDSGELSRYLLHFIDEETRHMMYFAGFCRRFVGDVYPDRTLHAESSGDAELDTLLLFARINVFEEIVDHYNRIMAKDERLAPVVREINRIHHVEELRHLQFGRRFLKESLERHVERWDAGRREELRQQLSAYVEFVWKQYYNPQAYRDAGIDDALALRKAAFDAPAAREHRRAINERRLSYLRKLELLEAA